MKNKETKKEYCLSLYKYNKFSIIYQLFLIIKVVNASEEANIATTFIQYEYKINSCKYQNPGSFESSCWNFLTYPDYEMINTNELILEEVSIESDKLLIHNQKDLQKKNLLDEKELCKLHSISIDDFLFFQSIMKHLEFKKLSEIKNLEVEHIDEMIKFRALLCDNCLQKLVVFDCTHKNKTYLLEVSYTNGGYNSIFIPEIALIKHRYILSKLGMFFNIGSFNLMCKIGQYEYRYSEVAAIGEEINMAKKIEFYCVLKNILRVAKAIEYLNKVHSRVQGNLDPSKINCKALYSCINARLYDFESSIILGENEYVRLKYKRIYIEFCSPEERRPNSKHFFCRKSEVWSLGCLLLHYNNIIYNNRFKDHKFGALFQVEHNGSFVNFVDVVKCKDKNNCNVCKIKDLACKILITDIESRPNITECIQLFYERILDEETYLNAQFDIEEEKIMKEEEILNKEHKTFETEKIKLKRDRFNAIKTKFYKKKRLTIADKQKYDEDIKSFHEEKIIVEEKRRALDIYYCRRG